MTPEVRTSDLDDEILDESVESRNKERIFTIIALTIVAVLTIADLVEDRMEGASLPHLLTEGFVVLAAVTGALYLMRKVLRKSRATNRELYADMLSARGDAQKWRREASSLLQGLGVAIDEQFENWNLTEAEKEVGLLLLKGLSHKEIAEVRSTSEKTVRQQAASLYSKGNLEGRAQLSAFFLEDLLLSVGPAPSES